MSLKEVLLGISVKKEYRHNIDIREAKKYFEDICWHGLEDYLIDYILDNKKQIETEECFNKIEKIYMKRQIIVKYKLEELADIVAILENSNINFAVIKGFSTVYWMNEEFINAKASSDFDLLVQESQVEAAKNILIRAGYIQMESQEKYLLRKQLVWHVSPLEKKSHCIELHHRFTQIYDRHTFDVSEALRNKVYITLRGVTFPVLNLEDSIFLLTLHLYQHEYKDITFQLKHHAEIVNIILNNKSAINWENLVLKIKRNNACFPAAYSLYHTNFIYKLNMKIECVPDNILIKIQPDDFLEKKDMLTHRHMYDREPFGNWDYHTNHWKYKYGKEWEGGYEGRLFGNMKEVTLRYYYLFFRHYINNNIKEECEKIGLEFAEDIFF